MQQMHPESATLTQVVNSLIARLSHLEQIVAQQAQEISELRRRDSQTGSLSPLTWYPRLRSPSIGTVYTQEASQQHGSRKRTIEETVPSSEPSTSALLPEYQTTPSSSSSWSPRTPAPSNDDELPRKKKKQAGVRASDLEDTRKQIVDGALPIFRIKLAAITAYPSQTEARRWASDSWFESLSAVDPSINVGTRMPTDYELKVIQDRISQVRSMVKDCAKARVKTCRPEYRFGLQSDPTTVEEMANNRDRAQYLVTKKAFSYKIPGDNSSMLYGNDIILDVIKDAWFNKGMKGDGHKFSKLFENGIPLPLIAFVATMVQFALEEWKTGVHVSAVLGPSSEQIFQDHLSTLTKWHAFSSAPGRTPICRQLQMGLLQAVRIFFIIIVNGLHEDLVGLAALVQTRREEEVQVIGEHGAQVDANEF
ncbi:hypothetical protein FISHEDRAFT_62006 [Fistulina hepatica ATCC 64428]|nr:hypothetical protein FISHEDRAFT_62006 [Fistulina hepatica ATCC 64428]